MNERPTRYRCDLDGRFEAADGRLFGARILELSETGAFVESEVDLEFGAHLSLGIPLPGGEPWWAEIEVTRIGRGQKEVRLPKVDAITVTCAGYGVRFLQVPDDEVERLRGYLDLLDER